MLLLGIGLAVTVFRGAYEQIGNTFALWMRDDVDRVIAGVEIGAAMFFSLNPLLVMVMTPLLLARWKRQAERGTRAFGDAEDGGRRAAGRRFLSRSSQPPRRSAADGSAHWLWLLSFFLIFTLGELYILPNGLGIFARLAPPQARREHGRRLVSSRSSPEASPPARSGGCGATSTTSASSSCSPRSRPPRRSSSTCSTSPTKRVLARAAGRGAEERDLTDVPEGIARPRRCLIANHSSQLERGKWSADHRGGYHDQVSQLIAGHLRACSLYRHCRGA